MAGQPNRPRHTSEHLEELTVEQLEKLLCASVDFSDSDEEYEEYIDAIVDTIVRKEHENPTGRLPKVDEAWRRFRENFDTEEGEGLSLYPDDVEEQPPAKPEKSRKNRFNIGWKRFAAVAAVLLICAVTVAPPALGYRDFFAMMGEWHQSIFRFFGGSQGPEVSEAPEVTSYDSLQEALDAYGITTPVVPVMPEGYEVDEVVVRKYPEVDRVDFNALYKNGDSFISMHVTKRENGTTRQFEKDENIVEKYAVNGIVHYIFRNNGQLMATWYVDNLECSIQSGLPVDELKIQIDSIYER